jgi:hypothetical protein
MDVEHANKGGPFALRTANSELGLLNDKANGMHSSLHTSPTSLMKSQA